MGGLKTTQVPQARMTRHGGGSSTAPARTTGRQLPDEPLQLPASHLGQAGWEPVLETV